jgi:hypothetical protein
MASTASSPRASGSERSTITQRTLDEEGVVGVVLDEQQHAGDGCVETARGLGRLARVLRQASLPTQLYLPCSHSGAGERVDTMANTGQITRGLPGLRYGSDQAHLLATDRDDVALAELASTPRLEPATHRDHILGQQRSYVRTGGHEVRQLQQLTQPDAVLTYLDLPHQPMLP